MAIEDRITAHTVVNCSRLHQTWSIILMSILVQSRSHVDTVQNLSSVTERLSHICWSHTMKELGSRVVFVGRNSAIKLLLRNTYGDMKVWSRMFAMNLQSVSVHQLNWNYIRSFTLMSKSFVVVFVAKTSNDHSRLNDTLGNVLMPLNLAICCDTAWLEKIITVVGLLCWRNDKML